MAIERKSLVARHFPILNGVDPTSPLSVGNGSFAFTADCTGLQTLYDLYAETTPLCTMAHWGTKEPHGRPLAQLVLPRFRLHIRRCASA